MVKRANLNESASSLTDDDVYMIDGRITKRFCFLAKGHEDVYKLMVNGVRMDTYRATLLKYRTSFLHDMFSGEYGLPLQDKDGRFIINRPASSFRNILNVLRNEHTFIHNEEIEVFRNELKHFKLDHTIEIRPDKTRFLATCIRTNC